MWCARRVRRLTIFSSATIAFIILLFGAGIYSFFTIIIYEGEEAIQDNFGWVLFVLAPFLLAIVGGILTAILAKNVGRLSRQPGAPPSSSNAKWVLWISALLWFLLIIVFIISALMTSESENSDDGDFPIGLFTLLPAYIGFSLAVFTSGAAMAAGSEENKLETMLVVGLGWAAFVVFLILPALLNSWSIGSGEELDWESVIFWLRFGNLFPAILPWLIVIALSWTHGKSIEQLETLAEPPPHGGAALTTTDTGGGGCATCGGALTVHPRTQEIFCTACGAGLSPDVVVVEAEPSDYEFVEQEKTPEPSEQPAPTHDQVPVVAAAAAATPTPSPEPAQQTPKFCTLCGGELATLSKAHRLYCTACGAGLPGSGAEPVPPAQPQTAPTTQAPQPSQARSQATVKKQAQASHAPQPSTPPAVQAPLPGYPTTTPKAVALPSSTMPDKCKVCGGRVTVHPKTQETFCPACGAGL